MKHIKEYSMIKINKWTTAKFEKKVIDYINKVFEAKYPQTIVNIEYNTPNKRLKLLLTELERLRLSNG